MLVGVVCSMVEADNASKRGRELEIVVDRKSVVEFRKFGALSFDGEVL